MNKIMVILLSLCIILAGCMSDDNSGKMESDPDPVVVQDGYANHSWQFWNAAPMSMGNNTIISFNNSSGDVNLTLELSGFFHEPSLSSQGYVNYTLFYQNETVFSKTVTQNSSTYYINVYNVSNNITLQIQSSGSDNKTTSEPGDFFIAKTKYVMYE